MFRAHTLLPVLLILTWMGASCAGAGAEIADVPSRDGVALDAGDVCVPDCDGRACGDDGCGGTCGDCADGDECLGGACEPVLTAYPNACLGPWQPSAPDCGAVRRQGCCDDSSRVVWCERGALFCVDCAGGQKGACGWKDRPLFVGYDCGGDGADPRGLFPQDCGVACVPDCLSGVGGARECGDDGCGGRCGECDPEWLCTEAGVCEAPPGGVVQGYLEYEARQPVLDEQTGPELDPVPVVLPASGLPVTVSDVAGAVVGEAVVDADGRFRVPLSRPLAAGDSLVFAAVGPGPAGPLFAILRPESGGAVKSVDPPAWAWSHGLDGLDIGTVRLTEAQGSGAVHAFRLVSSAMEVIVDGMAGGDATQVEPLAVLWAPGVSWDCGYCFAAGVPQIPAEGVHLTDSVFLDGHPEGSSAWGAAAVLHEVGHSVLKHLSRNDSIGGSHVSGDLLIPPFAWAEGWTNFFGISTHSRFLGAPDARLWAIVFGASGTRVAFWMDFAHGQGAAKNTILPDSDAGMDQSLDERWVTRALWELWDGGDVFDSGIEDGWLLGTNAMARALVSKRVLRMDRGYAGTDLVDFIDALVCDDFDRAADLDALVRGDLGFPYDGAATCP